MSSPPPTVVYVLAGDDYYWSRRDWRGSDIAFVTLVGVLLLVTFACLFADCYTGRPERSGRGQGRRREDDEAAWRVGRDMARSDFI